MLHNNAIFSTLLFRIYGTISLQFMTRQRPLSLYISFRVSDIKLTLSHLDSRNMLQCIITDYCTRSVCCVLSDNQHLIEKYITGRCHAGGGYHYHIHKSQPLVHILSQINPFHAFQTDFLNIHLVLSFLLPLGLANALILSEFVIESLQAILFFPI